MSRHVAYRCNPPPVPDREVDGFVLIGETMSDTNLVRRGSSLQHEEEDLPPSYEMAMSMSQTDLPPSYSELPPSLPYLRSVSLPNQYSCSAPTIPHPRSQSCADDEFTTIFEQRTPDLEEAPPTREGAMQTRRTFDTSHDSSLFRLSDRLLSAETRNIDIPRLPSIDLDRYNYDFSLERCYLRDSEAEQMVGTLVQIDSPYDAGWNIRNPCSSDDEWTDVLEISGFG